MCRAISWVWDATKEMGVYGDGAYGHDHVRLRLRELLRQVRLHLRATHPARVAEVDEVMDKLDAHPSDDCWEETWTLDIMNEFTVSGSWGFYEGSLILQEEEWWQYFYGGGRHAV